MVRGLNRRPLGDLRTLGRYDPAQAAIMVRADQGVESSGVPGARYAHCTGPAGRTASHGCELLSGPERQILSAVAEGRTERGVARELGWAPGTAHSHKVNALKKLRQALAAQGWSETDLGEG